MENKTEITIRAYNRHAVQYTARFMDYAPYREKLIAFQQAFLPAGARILDLGCGPGNNAKTLQARDAGCRITGVDLSAEMIALARENVPGGCFRVADVRGLKTNCRYDGVIASFCIVHLSDAETDTLLGKLSVILKKGGALYLSFMAGRPAGFETTSFSPDEIFFNYHNRDNICAAMERYAIEPAAVFTEPYPEEDGSTTEDVFIFARRLE